LSPDDPIRGLLKLYAHSPDAINELQLARVNPDFNQNIRNDLEFYIPQLCSMYLQGNLENQD
jgi:hypothetical protein